MNYRQKGHTWPLTHLAEIQLGNLNHVSSFSGFLFFVFICLSEEHAKTYQNNVRGGIAPSASSFLAICAPVMLITHRSLVHAHMHPML